MLIKEFNIKETKKYFVNKKSLIIMGKFLSLHLGHQKLLKDGEKYAKNNNLNLVIMVYPDYDSFIGKKISFFPLKSRVKLLNQYSPDLILLFNPSVENYSIKLDVFFSYLKNNLNVSTVFTGKNFTFNKKGVDDFKILSDNFDLNVVPLVKHNGKIISTTMIKLVFMEKDFLVLRKLLGFNFFYEGEVIYGNNLGSKINVPTANVKVDSDLINIPMGVYFSSLTVDKVKYDSITSVSTNPTVSEDSKINYETNIFSFNKSIYGKHVYVELLKFHRNTKKFSDFNMLKENIFLDITEAKEYFKKTKRK